MGNRWCVPGCSGLSKFSFTNTYSRTRLQRITEEKRPGIVPIRITILHTKKKVISQSDLELVGTCRQHLWDTHSRRNNGADRLKFTAVDTGWILLYSSNLTPPRWVKPHGCHLITFCKGENVASFRLGNALWNGKWQANVEQARKCFCRVSCIYRIVSEAVTTELPLKPGIDYGSSNWRRNQAMR